FTRGICPKPSELPQVLLKRRNVQLLARRAAKRSTKWRWITSCTLSSLPITTARKRRICWGSVCELFTIVWRARPFLKRKALKQREVKLHELSGGGKR